MLFLAIKMSNTLGIIFFLGGAGIESNPLAIARGRRSGVIYIF